MTLVENRQSTVAQTVPRHVAIIPDGNRRWAKRERRDLLHTYVHATRVIDRLSCFLVDRGVEHVTVWPVSPRNWRRDWSDLEPLIEAFENYVAFARSNFVKRGFRAHTIGRLDRLRTYAPELVAAIHDLKDATAHLDRAHVTLAFDYAGRDELVRAVQRMLEDRVEPSDVSAELIGQYLDTASQPDPDLVVRCGGDRRLSGFMPYQSEYAEIHFSNTLTPDFTEDEMAAILEQFARRRYSQ